MEGTADRLLSADSSEETGVGAVSKMSCIHLTSFKQKVVFLVL